LSDTITLIAGILLTSVGLLALSPLVLRLGRKGLQPANPLQGALMPALAATDAFLHPEEHMFGPAGYRAEGVDEDVEELMAHLFSLRMTVSEIAAEVQGVQDVIAGETPDGAAVAIEDSLDSGDEVKDHAVEHAA
jgi:hypothetical protein